MPNATASIPASPPISVCVCSVARCTRQSPAPTSYVLPSCQERPEPPRTKKISSSASSTCAGVERLPGSTCQRVTPIATLPAAVPRSVWVDSTSPSSARLLSASSQCATKSVALATLRQHAGERGCGSREHDDECERHPGRDRDGAGADPREPGVEHELVVAADRLGDDERGQEHRSQQRHSAGERPGQPPAAEQHGPGRLERDRGRADDEDDDPDRAHDRFPSPSRHAVPAATIGTPAGVTGINARAIPAAARAATDARGARSWGTSSARKSAGNAPSRPRSFGPPSASPASTPTAVPLTQA